MRSYGRTTGQCLSNNGQGLTWDFRWPRKICFQGINNDRSIEFGSFPPTEIKCALSSECSISCRSLPKINVPRKAKTHVITTALNEYHITEMEYRGRRGFKLNRSKTMRNEWIVKLQSSNLVWLLLVGAWLRFSHDAHPWTDVGNRPALPECCLTVNVAPISIHAWMIKQTIRAKRTLYKHWTHNTSSDTHLIISIFTRLFTRGAKNPRRNTARIGAPKAPDIWKTIWQRDDPVRKSMEIDDWFTTMILSPKYDTT